MRVHLLVNPQRADAVAAASEAVSWLRERKVEVGATPETAFCLSIPEVDTASLANADLVVSFGGDGTLIRAADLCSEKGTPILGVYYGRFGFVTQCQGPEVPAQLERFLAGEARFENRMMLQTELLRAGQVIATLHSLNEMVLQRTVTVRMMTFEVQVDGHVLTRYPADGIMIATPTGSTAYNLSAGGIIVDPRVEAMLLTAIAPHTLSARPLALAPDSEIRLKVQADGDAVLSGDGQNRLHLLSKDEVRVTRSPRVTRLMSVRPDDFLVKLGERLLWSQSLLGQGPLPL